MVYVCVCLRLPNAVISKHCACLVVTLPLLVQKLFDICWGSKCEFPQCVVYQQYRLVLFAELRCHVKPILLSRLFLVSTLVMMMRMVLVGLVVGLGGFDLVEIHQLCCLSCSSSFVIDCQ